MGGSSAFAGDKTYFLKINTETTVETVFTEEEKVFNKLVSIFCDKQWF